MCQIFIAIARANLKGGRVIGQPILSGLIRDLVYNKEIIAKPSSIAPSASCLASGRIVSISTPPVAKDGAQILLHNNFSVAAVTVAP